MTTIAYKDGVIAYDGRATTGSGTIVYDDLDKCVERDGVKFVLCGNTCGIHKLIEAYFGESHTSVNTDALIVVDGEVWYISHDDDEGIEKSQVLLDRPYALGSGSDHAYTAMDMGATAYQAVEMAAKRDTSTGGTIRTVLLAEPGKAG
ncbi:proteasome subunit beta [Pseudomonas sp. GL-B-16]|uniref:proteasome subunit beta n=1 Tax=Pseudomonas sp. GL-B-16 TaxID=2832373 RepID=UPI001CC13736|nr:proteasome subunit beta [Pseudomonas sp. GL-B-16]